MRVLFLTHRLPYAPNRGDRTRAYHAIRLLAPHFDMHVGALVHNSYEAAQVDRVRALGADVSTFSVPRIRNHVRGAIGLAGHTPLTHFLLDSPEARPKIEQLVARHRPDVVFALCSSMAKFALWPPLKGIPLVIDMIDVDSVKWSTFAEKAPWPMRWVYSREARLLSAFEARAARHAVETLVVNQREAKALEAIAPDARVTIMTNGADLRGFDPPALASRAGVVFCGVMNYKPNVEGISWFVREIWPRIRRQRPDEQLTIVGSDPVESLIRLATPGSGVVVTGTVPDVREYLWNAAVAIAPLLTARGVQSKVLEAIACGLPAVVTSQVSEGLPVEIHSACRVADAAEDFARHVLALLECSPDDRRRVVKSADLHALSWESVIAPLHEGLLRAAGPNTLR